MTGWIEPAVPHLKALHIAALSIWCAGIIVLPLVLARHQPPIRQSDYSRIRRFSHSAYTLAVTPAGVIAIATGTALVFGRQVFVPWMFLKLVFVGALAGVHAWIGYTIIAVAESGGRHRPPLSAVPITLSILPMLAILVLVLGKPSFTGVEFPAWLTQPRGHYLPFDVPKR